MSLSSWDPLTLMVSSRCSDKVRHAGKLKSMTGLRKDLKAELEKMKICGFPAFEAWIHEDDSVTPGDQGSWDTCLDKSRQADIFLALRPRPLAYSAPTTIPGLASLIHKTTGV